MHIFCNATHTTWTETRAAVAHRMATTQQRLRSNTNVSFDSGCGKLRQLRLSRKNTLSSTSEPGVYSEKTWQWKELLDASHRTGQASAACRPQKLADYYWSNLIKPCEADRRTGVSCTSFVTSDKKIKKITANKTPECVICGLGLKAGELIFQCIDEARAALMRCQCLFHHKSLMDARRRSEFLWRPFLCNVL